MLSKSLAISLEISSHQSSESPINYSLAVAPLPRNPWGNDATRNRHFCKSHHFFLTTTRRPADHHGIRQDRRALRLRWLRRDFRVGHHPPDRPGQGVFTSFVGWKRLICAATHGTQCTYVSRQAQSAGNDRKKSAGGLIGGWHWGFYPKFWMEAFALMLRTEGPFATGTIEQASSAVSASAFCDSSRVRSEKRSLAFGRPPIVQAASVTCQYFCYGDGPEGNTNQMRILFHPLSLS